MDRAAPGAAVVIAVTGIGARIVVAEKEIDEVRVLRCGFDELDTKRRLEDFEDFADQKRALCRNAVRIGAVAERL